MSPLPKLPASPAFGTLRPKGGGERVRAARQGPILAFKKTRAEGKRFASFVIMKYLCTYKASYLNKIHQK